MRSDLPFANKSTSSSPYFGPAKIRPTNGATARSPIEMSFPSKNGPSNWLSMPWISSMPAKTDSAASGLPWKRAVMKAEVTTSVKLYVNRHKKEDQPRENCQPTPVREIICTPGRTAEQSSEHTRA